MTAFRAAYLELARSGTLRRRVEAAYDQLADCTLCARHCRVDRFRTLKGAACLTGERAMVPGAGPHHGALAPLRGWAVSGTIFFSSCNLRCVYCQNWEISQKRVGREMEPEELASLMLDLQDRGCHNINLVSPSHVVAQVLASVDIAAGRGLSLPIVYNSGGYDSAEALALLDGVVDIYMPDMKYGDSFTALRLSKVKRYVEVNRAAVREMHRQVGDLVIGEDGLARRGLLVRHLVLPGNLSDTGKVLRFIAEELSPQTYVNLMDQYQPCYRASEYPPLDRPLLPEEHRKALARAERLGLTRLDGRAPASRD